MIHSKIRTTPSPGQCWCYSLTTRSIEPIQSVTVWTRLVGPSGRVVTWGFPGFGGDSSRVRDQQLGEIRWAGWFQALAPDLA